MKMGEALKTSGRWFASDMVLLSWGGVLSGAGVDGATMIDARGFCAPLRTNLDSRSLSMLWRRMMRLMKKEAIAAPVMVQ